MGPRTPRSKATTFGQDFGERLKATREQRGFTLEELAEKAGMHSGRLSEYESGRHTPQLEKAAKLAEVLEVALDELVERRPSEARRTCATRGYAPACARWKRRGTHATSRPRGWLSKGSQRWRVTRNSRRSGRAVASKPPRVQATGVGRVEGASSRGQSTSRSVGRRYSSSIVS